MHLSENPVTKSVYFAVVLILRRDKTRGKKRCSVMHVFLTLSAIAINKLEEQSWTDRVDASESTQFEGLISSFEHDINHDTHFSRNDVVRRVSESCSFLFKGLESVQRSTQKQLQQVTRHQLQSLLQMVCKHIIRPV